MSWHEIHLGDAIHVKHGFAFKSQHFSDSGEYVVLTPGNFNEEGGFRLRPKKDRFYIGDIPEDFILNEGDLIVAMTEQGPGLLGSSALIPEGGKYLHNQRLGLIQNLNEKVLNRIFLYYLFNTRLVRGQIYGSASGTKVRHTAPERIYRVKATVPLDATEQKRIGVILSAYDDLIENNRRRIQLLEQAARLLYKEWFVHLRFPGHEHVKITDGVPDGWEKKTYSDYFQFLGGFAFKSKTYQADGTYGVVTIKNAHDARFVPECPSRVNSAPEKMKEHCLLKTGDVLLSLTGNVGRACIVFGENYFLNQRVAKIVGIPELPRSFTYWTFSNEATQKDLENLAYGVAQLNLSPVNLGKRDFVKPSSTLLEFFAETADPIFEQICTLNLQTMELAKARDLLLPRLMNGELTV